MADARQPRALAAQPAGAVGRLDSWKEIASHLRCDVRTAQRWEKGDGLPALFGRTVCVTIGNSTNAELAVRGGRLMLFASARQLVEQVRNGACALAAHDDSLLLPLLPAGHEVKASFAPLPWGVVVPLDGASMARVFS